MNGSSMERLAGSCICLAVAWMLAAPLSSQEVLVKIGDTWRYFKGTEEPWISWKEIDFDDSSWLKGPSGFGYSDNDDATVLSDMQNNYWSVYLRKAVEIPDLSQARLLQLGVDYDDGFVAYFNGIEVARVGLTGSPPAFNAAAASHDATGVLEKFLFPAGAMASVRQGTNVLAIQVHNTSLSSSDLTLRPELTAYSQICPFNLTCTVLTSGSVRLRWQTSITPAPYDAVDIYRNGEFLATLPNPASLLYTDSDPLSGQNVYQVVAIYNGEECRGDDTLTCRVPEGESFRRGDADDSGSVNLTDAIRILQALFQGGQQPACPDSADADDSGQVNLTDAVNILQHLFQGGGAPAPPGPTDCGEDPTDDTLGDCEYTSCTPR
ncbi:MAG: hypothetical protein JXA90_10685 [Planctomycetes bacterium]|nr:hypothetical protein [Planctomycetota bacterium]